MVMSLVLQVSGHPQKYWGNRKFDLMMELDERQGITKVSRCHPLGTMNICIKCNGNPSNSF